MPNHPALAAGRVAVITGGASGIGLAAARRFLSLGMKVAIADMPGEALEAAGHELGALVVPTDVSSLAQVAGLRDRVYRELGEVAVLMNNAGIGAGGGAYEKIENWRRLLEVNLWGVINGVQSFVPAMLAQKTDCAVINTGSKQGITCPPGNTAYNVSKAGVKALTEALAHSLRNEEGGRITAHLLVPGSTFTGMTRGNRTEKPAGSWTPDQVIDRLVEAMNDGKFYVICPDNDVTTEIDNRRILWAAQDLTENRPALSRWHPDYKDEFARFLEG